MFHQLLTWGSIFLVGSGGAWLGTEIVKRIKFIPIDSGMVAALRATALFFSALITVSMGYLDGQIDPSNVQSLLVALCTMLLSWGGAHVFHKVEKATNSTIPNA